MMKAILTGHTRGLGAAIAEDLLSRNIPVLGISRNAHVGLFKRYPTTHHARAVALDQTPGVRICSLAPGVIDTDMQAEIRATSLEQFPLRERFEGLKRDGQLSSPTDCATRLVNYLLSDAFGNVPVADLREVAG
jgi:benzil reductase ((S)-benzoin forming)